MTRSLCFILARSRSTFETTSHRPSVKPARFRTPCFPSFLPTHPMHPALLHPNSLSPAITRRCGFRRLLRVVHSPSQCDESTAITAVWTYSFLPSKTIRNPFLSPFPASSLRVGFVRKMELGHLSFHGIRMASG